MKREQLISLVESTLKVADEVALNSKYLKTNQEPLLSTIKVLNALKTELKNNPNDIKERLLRAMHDVGMSSYKEFENTLLEDAITNLIYLLNREVPHYKNLQPLRGDFGNGDPV